MSALIHSLSTLGLRFRREILGYLLLLLASALADLGSHGSAAVLGSLTNLAFFWVTLRVALSETGFKTHGGWQTRPFNPRTVLAAQLLLLAALALATCLVRFLVLQSIFHPDAARWLGLMEASFRSGFVPWVGFVVLVKGFAFLLLRPLEGHARRAAWAAMVIVLVPFLLAVAGGSNGRERGGTGRYPGSLSQGIRLELRRATEFIGLWNESLSYTEVPTARLFARIPLGSGQPAFPRDLRVAGQGIRAGDRRIHLDLELLALDPHFLSRLANAVPVLAYRGGYYGSAMSYQINPIESRGITGGIPKLGYRLEFASPLSLPENRDAGPADFPPTEVLFFVPGSSSLPVETGNPGSAGRAALSPRTCDRGRQAGIARAPRHRFAAHRRLSRKGLVRRCHPGAEEAR